ncbi:heat-inducible transcription repressor HrcA [Bifidobacterium bohemicum]|uniref:Heat-inducible transcription repressor HrcA n=1 Tax=Bifidobacterium bohemicum DSM 22767 TaxID=1437606 RepID=A0A086ZJ49_9BIFI|nr:heat-inducible transcriptional repressor HrcA [Bifidobacterium bohemicum]KFI46549.1 heat-inducible transcription repressor [Bifidobacterium bohemicum DSM 22767]SCB74802.1 heat-inducible transcription repressor HrcA [Bifidobacterium bohemicum]
MKQSRRMLVLRAVIEDYIRTQEPVGSSTLAREYGLGVSSATIRNDMAALEDEGYLIQPHTSAGRIPTERGYRYFVDELASVVRLSAAQRRAIANFLSDSVSLQDALERSVRLLSHITGQVAIVSGPSLAKSRVRRIEIVPLSTTTMLAVIITDAGSVAQHTLSLDVTLPSDRIMDLSDEINRVCINSSLSAAAGCIRRLAAVQDLREMSNFAIKLARTVEAMANDERSGQLYIAGTSQLAHQQPTEDLAPLFDALEEQAVIMRLMNNLSQQNGEVGVAIGSETKTPGLMSSAVVSSGYGHSMVDQISADRSADADRPDNDNYRQDAPVAFVGSIGPTHMDYAATMSAVRAVARYLTELIAQDDTGWS